MNKASTNINPYYSFHSTAEFGRGYYKNHCGPTAITNLIVTARQRQLGTALSSDEVRDTFEKVASMGKRSLIYNRRYGTTDFLLWFYVKAAFKKLGIKSLRPVMRHTLSAGNARRILSKGSFLLIELFGHPKYGWHQMVIYDTDERGLFIAADGFSSSPVFLNDKEIGRGLFLEIASR
ncbi:MAG: hypothetical protein IJ075_03700 [Lachnospiraceae bacterium]|nr:hypothetical protein [Lachnospiraceae bacterium]MBQ9607750.1 hypothetical protein [Lachnospiraceae bacterium]MBR1524623.1 hypothetical protein [Lachnospiraceae bacterium]